MANRPKQRSGSSVISVSLWSRNVTIDQLMEDLWYSGLRAIGRRAVTRDDALIIDHLRHDRLLRLLLALLGAPLVVGLGWIAALFSGTGEPIAIAGSAACFFAVALRPWRTVPAFSRQLKALACDLRSGEVLVCEGRGCDLIFTLSAEQRIEPAALIKGSAEERLEIELLSESGAILTIDGAPVHSWNKTERGATAATYEHARLAAQFVEELPDHEGVGVGSRAFSSEEIAELLTHAAPVSTLDHALLLGLALLAMVSWWRAFAAKTPTLFLPVVSLVAFGWFAVHVLRRWRIHRRFAPDLRLGRLAIVTNDKDSSVVEFLPLSGVVWSKNHAAAPWRRLPLHRRTFLRRGGTS